MTDELKQAITNSFYRQLDYIELLKREQDFFMKQPINPLAKQTLARLYSENKRGVEFMLKKMPYDGERVKQRLENPVEQDKLAAIGNIVEKLFAIDYKGVCEIEKQFEESVLKE